MTSAFSWQNSISLCPASFCIPRTNFPVTPSAEVKASACNVGDLGSISGSGRSPGEGNGTPLQYSCLENPMVGGALWAAVHGVTKSRTRLSDFTVPSTYSWAPGFPGGSVVKNLPAMQETQVILVPFLGQQDPLEEEMVTHPNILTWKIPWTEKPGRLQSMGSQRVGHD